MKKRIVAVLLSLTLSSAMMAEAGAAALTDVSATAQSADMFTDAEDAGTGAEVGTETDGETVADPVTDAGTGADENLDIGSGDGTGSGTGSDEASTGDETQIQDPDTAEDGTGTPSEEADTSGDVVVENPIEVTEPDVDFTDDLFSSGENTDPVQEPETEVLIMEDESAAAAAAVEAEGKLLYTRWEGSGDKWKLQKLPKTSEITVDNTAVQSADAAVSSQEEAEAADIQNTADIQVTDAAAVAAGETVQTAEDATAADMQTADIQTMEAADVNVAEESAAAAAAAPEYYTDEDGLVTITTIDVNGSTLATGTYLFDANGYLVTGRKIVKKGTKGFTYSEDAEFYFLPYSKATVTNKNTAAGNNITPYSSKLGQMQKNVDWLWDGGAFHNYGSDGRAETISPNKIYKIGSDSYYLLSGGKPFVGQKYIKISGKTQLYYFAAASSSSDIPGKMQKNKWISRVNRGKTQWLYFGSDGRYVKKGCGAYKLIPSRDVLYVLDNSGYLVKNKVVKGANGYYYMSNRYGHAYRNKLVKYGKYRYYFVSDGRRATYRNRWVRLPGAGNRYYYFGSVRGRIQEKYGFQKITIGGKFIGWFYFSKAGNHYIDYFSGGRYFLPDGRMASGVCKVDGRYYFFERSSRNVYRGKMYKGTWIKYNGYYYYAASNGTLATNGWRTIRGDYYYFKSLKALTNYNIKRGNVYGRLNSRGKFVTGWMVANDAKNRARYMDPSTGRFLKNTSKTIDGKLYYFDSNGYRRTDLTDIYKGPYYLEVDRVNGVMTVYTNSRKTVPVKTIRVSVGLPATETKTGKFKLTRADRWQLLMGPSWGQYGTHVTGGIYIHSVASGLRNANNLPADEYLKLGSPASHGCIRCCVADAKWVWENCNGAWIYIFDGKYQSEECFKGPLGRNPITPLRGSGTFDPTDPIYN